MAAKKKRPSIDEYLTIPQAIELLKVPKPTVYYWLKIDQLPSDFIGDTKIVLRKDALEAKRNM